MLDITRRLAERRMVEPLMQYVATTVFELIPAERCMIVRFDEDGTPHVDVALSRQGQPLGASTDQMSRSILDRVRASLSPLRVGDALSENALKEVHSVRSLGLRSVMCVPLISFGQAIGAIYVENRSARNQFREENLLPLILFSHQVVVALENARAYEALEERIAERTRELQEANALLARQAEELRELSIRDALTGLHNRRSFNERLPQLFEMARRYDRPLALACLDIDNFKQINDTLLHTGGDQVLRLVAEILRETVRQSDPIARIGGEEFAIVMPETSLETAQAACDRLRQTIERYDWSSVSPDLRVTVSIGVADDHACPMAEELLRRADSALYQAKRLGKNRVETERAQG